MVSVCFGNDVWQCLGSVYVCTGVLSDSWLWRGVSMMHYSASRATHQCITGQSLQSTSALMDAKLNYSGDLKLSMGERGQPKMIWFANQITYLLLWIQKNYWGIFYIHKSLQYWDIMEMANKQRQLPDTLIEHIQYN